MKHLLSLFALLLFAAGSLFAQQVLFICTSQAACPGLPIGTVQAAVDQNGWRNFKLTLTQNVNPFSIVGTPPPSQAAITVIFTQDGVGSRTVTFASSIANPCTVNSAPVSTTVCQFTFDGTIGNWIGVTVSSGGTGTPAGNNGDVQLKNGANLGSGGLNDSGGIFSVTDDFSPKFNPYADVRRYGAVAFNPNTSPSTAGVTITCISGNNQAVASSVPFSIGYGIDAYGCGTATGMSTPAAPTIVPTLDSSLSNVGYGVNAPAGGATQICAKVIARAKAGGLTAPGPEACATGQNPGAPTIAITSCSASLNIATCNTAARSPEVLANGMRLSIAGTTNDGVYGGDVVVASLPNNTSFTYKMNLDTRAGTLASATGGTGTYGYSYLITAPAPGTNVFQYGYCVGPTGAETFYNTSQFVNSNLSADPAYLTFHYYGSPITTAANVPDRWPANCNNSATANDLVTTIDAIAGNTLTLHTAPSTTPPGATSLYTDSCPVVTAAFADQATNQQMVAFPPPTFGKYFVFNSLCDLSGFAGVGVSLTGKSIYLRDSLIINGSWRGDLIPASLDCPQFCLFGTSTINLGVANPGIVVNQGGRFTGTGFVANGNGYHALVVNGGSIPTGIWEYNSFSQSNGNNDCSGILITLFGKPTAGSNPAGLTFRDNLFTAGSCGFTPLFANYNFGEVHIIGAMMAHRGFFVKNGGTISNFVLDQKYEIQGGIMPLVTTFATSNNPIAVEMKHITLDTMSQPKLFNASPGQVTLLADNGGQPSGGIPMISGNPLFMDIGDTPPNTGLPNTGINTNVEGPTVGSMLDGIYGSTNAPINQAIDFRNIHTQIGPGYSLFTGAPQPAAPTCVTNTAGPPFSPAQTNTQFAYTVVYSSGGNGLLSPRSNACSADGATQQIQVTIPAVVPGNAGYNVYGSSLVGCGTPSTTSLVFLATAAYCGNQPPNQPGGGPTGMSNNSIWSQQIQFGGIPFASLGTPVNGIQVYCPDCTIANPCAGGGTGAMAKRLNSIWVCN